jgi:hypothetical protein
MAMAACALVATFVLAMPQAAAVGGPSPGLVASGVTLAAFFLVPLVVGAAIASTAALVLHALVRRLGASAASAPASRFVLGAAAMGSLVLAVPGSAELSGFLGAWSIAGGAGMATVGADAAGRARIGWRTLVVGCLAAIVVGLAALWLPRIIGR